MIDSSVRRRVRFGIWSDSPVAAEELQLQLRGGGQHAVQVNGDRTTPIECLVVLTRHQLSAIEMAMLTHLANRALTTVAVDARGAGPASPSEWPRDVTFPWSGQVSDLPTVASD